MSKKPLDENKRQFCRVYLDSLDAQRAAADCGAEDGWALLAQKDVQRCLAQAREYAGQSVGMEDILRRLCQIAFSRPNDAVALACGAANDAIPDLDLMAVSEFKYKDGAAEVKFADRVRALQVLGELLSSDRTDDSTAAEFFQALQESAGGFDGSAESG